MEELVNKLAMWQAERKTTEYDLNDDPEVAGCNETIAALEAQIVEARKNLVFLRAGYDTRISQIDDEIKHVSAQIIDGWNGEKKTLKYEAGTLSFRQTGSLRIIDDVRLMELLIEKAPIVDVVSKYIKGFKLTGVKKFVDVHNVPTGVASMEYKTTVGLKTELSG